MPDTPTSDPVPGDLIQARLNLLGAIRDLVRYARTLPETSGKRDVVRQAIQETTNALKRMYPTAGAESAHAHALRTLKIRPPGEERTPISGETLELYAAELVKWFSAYDPTPPEAPA
jgi:hypothetical protein